LRFVNIVPPMNVPDLIDLGFTEADIELSTRSEIVGGETEAQKQLDLLIAGEAKTLRESKLSPWLALGCLPVHSFYHAIVEANFPKNVLNKFLDELWWHDYYRFMFKKH